jgi:hypothetical protein
MITTAVLLLWTAIGSDGIDQPAEPKLSVGAGIGAPLGVGIDAAIWPSSTVSLELAIGSFFYGGGLSVGATHHTYYQSNGQGHGLLLTAIIAGLYFPAICVPDTTCNDHPTLGSIGTLGAGYGYLGTDIDFRVTVGAYGSYLCRSGDRCRLDFFPGGGLVVMWLGRDTEVDQ